MSELNNSTSARKHKEFLNESLGQKSVFYYKNGKHLWDRIVTGGKELYYKNSNYLYVKKNSEYKIWQTNKVSKLNEEITSIKILNKIDTILGYSCQILEVKSTFYPLTKGRKWLRRFYFNQNNFHINYKYLKKYKTNSQNKIYKLIKTLPLRIYVEIDGVKLDYVATSVERKTLDDSLFNKPVTN